jgi:hypothetical protein
MDRRQFLAAGCAAIAPAALAGASRPAPAGRIHLLCIGIDMAVKKAAKDTGEHDARMMGAVFGRYAPGRVQAELVGRATANKRGIVGGLATVCGRAGEGDTVFVFVSTHGGNDRGELTLWNKGQTVDGDDFREAFDRTRAAVVLAVDACHSGAILSEKFKNPRVALLAACGPRQSSYWTGLGPGKPFYGHFAMSLANGLAGAANADRNGSVTVGELARWVTGQGAVASRKQTARVRIPDAVAAVPLTGR